MDIMAWSPILNIDCVNVLTRPENSVVVFEELCRDIHATSNSFCSFQTSTGTSTLSSSTLGAPKSLWGFAKLHEELKGHFALCIDSVVLYLYNCDRMDHW